MTRVSRRLPYLEGRSHLTTLTPTKGRYDRKRDIDKGWLFSPNAVDDMVGASLVVLLGNRLQPDDGYLSNTGGMQPQSPLQGTFAREICWSEVRTVLSIPVLTHDEGVR